MLVHKPTRFFLIGFVAASFPFVFADSGCSQNKSINFRTLLTGIGWADQTAVSSCAKIVQDAYGHGEADRQYVFDGLEDSEYRQYLDRVRVSGAAESNLSTNASLSRLSEAVEHQRKGALGEGASAPAIETLRGFKTVE